MILAATLQDTGILKLELPPVLLAASYAIIGWSIGLRFNRPILAHVARAFPAVAASISALILLCAGIGYLLAGFAHVDPLTAYLATSPGGVDAVAIRRGQPSQCTLRHGHANRAIYFSVMRRTRACARARQPRGSEERMITVYSADHQLRAPHTELSGGQLVAPHECPQRAQIVLERVQSQRLGQVIAPTRFGMQALLRIHDEQYLEFLSTAWIDWLAAGNRGEAIPDCWPARRMAQRRPNSIIGKLGYYAMAGETSISAGTWEAALAAADVALTGACLLHKGERAAFALCRPPGHHAARDLYGGYCFLNNAALAAQYLRDQGADRIAILDVDFHHGNGTQDIFYDRADVLFVSLHADPADAFPFFLGYAEECGQGAGLGFTVNLPMPAGTEFGVWREALRTALRRIATFGADAMVISLGVDTFINDPISSFRLGSEDFFTYGKMIGESGLPSLFVLEGGYAVDEIGVNVVNVLAGFEGAA
jgi:acetoin utilization deacetylase AcuC-like enzyme